MGCPCLFSLQMYARLHHHKRLPGAPTPSQKSRHAFAQQPLAGFAPTKHRGEMLCWAGLRALVDGKKPRSVV